MASLTLIILILVLVHFLIFNEASATIVKITGTVRDFYGPVEGARIVVYDAVSVTCDEHNRLRPSADVVSIQPTKTNASGNFQILINVSCLFRFSYKKYIGVLFLIFIFLILIVINNNYIVL